MIQNDCEIRARRPIEVASVYLVIADISGYTRYLRKHGADITHAEQAVGELLESVISASGAPLHVYEISGDAVSFYALENSETNVANKIVLQARTFFDAFQKTMASVRKCPTYIGCEACKKSGDLKLKTVLHYGEAAMTEVGGFKKIAGTNVIFAHRLLKNSIEGDEYLLVTQPFYEQCGEMEWGHAVWTTESIDGLGDHGVLVDFPDGAPLGLRRMERTLKRTGKALRQPIETREFVGRNCEEVLRSKRGEFALT
jgi:class 3 adenylate cyclase